MDIFVTGASGYIGSTVAATLVARGHRVRGLARSPDAEARVRSTGATPVRGSLSDMALLASAAAEGDGVVHTAATQGNDRVATDTAAVTSMLAAMAGGVFVTTSAAPCARSSREPVSEEQTAEPGGPLDWLLAAEARVFGAQGVRGVVVRAPMVYGDGGGPVAGMVARGAAAGKVDVIDSGHNRWSTVHVRDIAVGYALLLERDEARGVFHASEAAPEAMRDVAGAVARAAGVPLAACTLAEAVAKHGPLAGFLAMDAALAADKLRGLGWRPAVGEALGGLVGALSNPAQRYMPTQ